MPRGRVRAAQQFAVLQAQLDGDHADTPEATRGRSFMVNTHLLDQTFEKLGYLYPRGARHRE